MRRPWLAAAALAPALLLGCGVELLGEEAARGEVGACEAPDAVLSGWTGPSSLPRLSPASPATPRQRYVVYFDQAAADVDPADLRLIERAGGRVARKLRGHRAVAAYLTPEELGEVRRQRAVRKVELDARRFPLAQTVPWGIGAIKAPEAWNMSAIVGPGAKVCVVDSGVRATHEDFRFGAASGTPEGWEDDLCGHGTHVAGTIAAFDDDAGVVGVNPNGLDLFAVRVFGDDCQWTWASELADAVTRCQEAGARVVNLSLGGFGGVEAEAAAFEAAWRSGMLLVAAAGNAGGTALEYPASYPSVISVGAVDEAHEVAAFSQKNAQVDLVAPGVKVDSTVPFVSRHTVEVDEKSWTGGPLHNAPPTAGVSGALVDGGLCGAAGDWSGKVVLCKRGEHTFAQKLLAVQQGGGVAAVVYNHEPSGFSGTLGDAKVTVPAVALSGVDGASLLGRIGSLAQVVSESERAGSGYATMSGTSMAAPHVTGLAAFLWGQAPSRTNLELREALERTAQDLGPTGRDDAYGHGLPQADRALQHLLAGAPPEGRPAAAFLATCKGLSCQFVDTSLSLAGTLVARRFDFGDGAQSDEARPAHRFARPGPHAVTLTARDDAGREAQVTVPISAIVAQVRAGPVKADGSREVRLSWQGVAGPTVVVVRDGEVLGQGENTGGAEDVLAQAGHRAIYRVCDVGLESCSEEVEVLPVCRGG